MREFRSIKLMRMELLVILALMMPLLYTQEKPKYTYEEYSDYMSAQKEQSMPQKEAALFEFLDKYPDSALLPNVLYEFQQYFDYLFKHGENDKVIATAVKLMEQCKDSTDVTEPNLAQAYFNKKDYANYLKFAESVYSRHPTPGMAYWLSIAAMKLKDTAKSEKYEASVEESAGFTVKVDLNNKLFQDYEQEGDFTQAIKHAMKVASLLEIPEKPADFKGDWPAYQLRILNPLYGRLGDHYLKTKDYPKAIEMFDKMLQRNPKDAVTQYYIGVAYRLDGKAVLAAEHYAKAVALNSGPISAKAAERLKKLIALAGVPENKYDEYIANAKKELGLE